MKPNFKEKFVEIRTCKFREQCTGPTKKIKKAIRQVKPGIKLRFMFNLMRFSQKNSTWNLVDRKHWEDNKWI